MSGVSLGEIGLRTASQIDELRTCNEVAFTNLRYVWTAQRLLRGHRLMPVGVFFDGFSSTAEMLEVCREAELAGASSLWFAQHMGYRDAIVWATAAASVTQRATLVPTAISPYLWPPLPVAMAISTLGELARKGA